uniref:Variant surface glycoprotein 1125.4037 n=1 Tax=Trypanosoma brucei TaxID=5691 RepID=A0A1J0R9V2_9TRYP|nr:variant surface glycoprotein 1125.4037 [Trypanosoma brucei]
MTRTALLALALTIAAAPNKSRGAPSAGENAAAFQTLCLAINAANEPDTPAPLVTKADEILQYAAAVNITLNGPEGVADLIANAEKEHKNLKNGTLQSKNCGEDKWEFCKAGAAKAKSIKDNSEFNAWRLAARPEHVVKQIVDTVETITQIEKELRQQLTASDDPSIVTDLAIALNGGDGSEGKYTLYDGCSRRKTDCGDTAGKAKGKKAGSSMAADALCLCGLGDGQTQNNVCSKFTGETVSETADGTKDLKTDWQKLKNICRRMRTSKKTTAATIRAAAAHFTTMVSQTQSDSNAINVLGKLNGNGASGCDGANSGTNGGACVYYGIDSEGGLANIQWLQLMLTAADKLDAARQAAAKAYSLEQQLISLNKTLATLATETTAAATGKADTQPDTKQDKQQDTGKQTECEKHTDKTAEQCKNLGCDHDSENKKCKTKVVEEGGKDEGKKEEKCTGKSKEQCKDGCKWEGTECKDSSILLNKQFALSMATDFMSLVEFKHSKDSLSNNKIYETFQFLYISTLLDENVIISQILEKLKNTKF